jgi:hypothetical protein
MVAPGSRYRQPTQPGTTGTQYNPFTGSYVNPTTGYFGPTAGVAGQSPTERAAYTAPQYLTDPTGRVKEFTPSVGAWQGIGTVGSAMGDGGGAGTRSASAGRGGGEFEALLSQIRGRPAPVRLSPTPPPQRQGDPYDKRAEAATYGAAKERTGLAMQAALRGLQGQMAQRGIRGSSIQADKMAQLFQGGLSELAGTDRQLAERTSERAFSAENQDLARLTQAGQFGDTFRAGEEQRAQQAALAELDNLIRVYGMAY